MWLWRSSLCFIVWQMTLSGMVNIHVQLLLLLLLLLLLTSTTRQIMFYNHT
jgi:hypothetical protein